jgi:signal recognition particle GTPase
MAKNELTREQQDTVDHYNERLREELDEILGEGEVSVEVIPEIIRVLQKTAKDLKKSVEEGEYVSLSDVDSDDDGPDDDE